MRLGFLASPPIVGAVSESIGLGGALWVIPLAGVAVIALGGALSTRPRATPAAT